VRYKRKSPLPCWCKRGNQRARCRPAKLEREAEAGQIEGAPCSAPRDLSSDVCAFAGEVTTWVSKRERGGGCSHQRAHQPTINEERRRSPSVKEISVKIRRGECRRDGAAAAGFPLGRFAPTMRGWPKGVGPGRAARPRQVMTARVKSSFPPGSRVKWSIPAFAAQGPRETARDRRVRCRHLQPRVGCRHRNSVKHFLVYFTAQDPRPN